MAHRLHIAISGPKDPSILVLTWCVTTQCPHGRTSTPWRRTCSNGCHRHSAASAARCLRVTPTNDILATAGVLAHGRRYGCGCDEEYWLAFGPQHHQLSAGAEIEPEETQVTGEDYEELRMSILTAKGPWEPEDER
jgi:hypothetical protein